MNNDGSMFGIGFIVGAIFATIIYLFSFVAVTRATAVEYGYGYYDT